MSRPVVAILCDTERIGKHVFHCVGDKYVRPIVRIVGALPWLWPALNPPDGIRDLLDRVDGLLLPGALSNVDPAHYDGPAPLPGTKADPARDGNALPLVRAALEEGVPLLAICRGFQELNVALGGSLHQRLHEVAGRFDHRERDEDPLDVQYGPAHPVRLTSDGLLRRWFDAEEIMVNSLHGQGIDRLAPGLVVEARAEDGTIEAVRVADASAFAVGVQWHPEWRPARTPHHEILFRRFAEAVARRAATRAAERRPVREEMRP